MANPAAGGALARPTTLTAYNQDGNVISTTDPRGIITQTDYDELNRPRFVIRNAAAAAGAADQLITETRYDADNNAVASVTDNWVGGVEVPQVAVIAYDAFNRKTTVTAPNPGYGSETTPVTTFAYDNAGDVLSQTDPNGNVTRFVYDRAGRKTETIQPTADGQTPTTQAVYDADGNVTSVTDPLGHVTSTVYNALNRKIEVIEPAADAAGESSSPPVSLQGYDADGNPTEATDPNGNATTTIYDRANRPIEVIQPDPDGAGPQAPPVTLYSYDAKGNVVATTNPLSETTQYAYDALNRKIQETDPYVVGDAAAPVTKWQYDLAGDKVAEIDPLGNAVGGVAADHTTNYVYDALGRQTEAIQPSIDGGITRPTTMYAFDSAGNELSNTDPAGNVTGYAYDGLNRQVSETDPLANASTTSYDANGNVLSTIDRDGRTVNYVYDALNRKTSETWLDTGAVTTWSYDAKGLLTQVSDSSSAYAYVYDNLDRPTTLTLTLAGIATPVVLSETYDADGNRIVFSANVNGVGDFSNAFGYDDLSRMVQIQQSDQSGGNLVAPKLVNLTYDAAGDMTNISRYADLSATSLVASSDYAYDGDSRLTSLQYALGTSTASGINYAFGYDLASRMTTQTTPDGTSTLTYDNDNELTGASLTGESYAYDNNGNRTASTLGAGTSGASTTNADNEIASDATYTYAYDKEGNLISRTKKDGGASDTFTYDDRNRLTQVVSKNGSGAVTETDTYAYDDRNNRIAKTVTNDIGAVTLSERYVYDADGSLLLVLDGTTGAVTERYLNGPAENEALAAEVNVNGVSMGTTRWLLADNEGSVRDVTDNAGLVVDHVEYDSFGNVVSQTNAAEAPRLGYTGQQFDAETGFNYDHARYYNPQTGTFIVQDPKGFSAGDENLYRYVGNSPLDGTDPTGMSNTPLNWGMSVDYNQRYGSLENNSNVIAGVIGQLQARADFHYNNINGLYGGSTTDAGADQKAYDYYSSQLQQWNDRYSQVVHTDTGAAAQIGAVVSALPQAISDSANARDAAIRNAGQQLGYTLEDMGRDAFYLGTATASYIDGQGFDGIDLYKGYQSDAENKIASGEVNPLSWSYVGQSAYNVTNAVSFGVVDEGVATAQCMNGYISLDQWADRMAVGGTSQVFAGAMMQAFGPDINLTGGRVGEASVENTMVSGARQQCDEFGGYCFRPGTPVLCSCSLQPIEQIGIGRRVRTAPLDEYGGSIDRGQYRVIRLSFAQEGQHELQLAFLRPAALVEGLGAGDFVPLSVLELKTHGRARVLAIEPCPPIEEGFGRLVTGTYRSESVDVRMVKLQGLDAPIEVTGIHPIFSEDRNGFVPASKLTRGERVRAHDGIAVVESVTHEFGRWEVFNIEVQGAHQYYVSERFVLVHNADDSCAFTTTAAETPPADLNRPFIRNSTRQAVEDAAPRTPDGRPIDPNTRQPIDGTPDLGHKTGNEFWREKEDAEAEGLTQQQFNDRMNDPSKYQLEDPSSNRSHKYEQP